jgi:hypothetical protein
MKTFAEFSPPRSALVEDGVLTASARSRRGDRRCCRPGVAAAPRFHGKKSELIAIVGCR